MNPGTQPLVSVVMPVYNASAYIRESIDSILQQTYTNWELVLVNDASTDDSAAIIHSYQDPRIRYFENEKNSGIVATRNRCLEAASGTYIAVLDNDDLATPDRLRLQVAYLEAHPETGLCGGYWDIIDGQSRKIATVRSPIEPIALKTFLLFNNCYCAATVMVRAGLLKKHQYEAGSDMIEDFNMYHRIYPETNFGMLPEILARYRVHGNNESIRKLEGLRALRSAIDRKILTRTGITYTPEEAQLHSAFFSGAFTSFKDKKQIRDLETWLLKYETFLKSHSEWDAEAAVQLFLRRWLTMHYNNRNFAVRNFTGPLVFKHKKLFFRALVGFIQERTAKKIQLC